MSNRPSYEYITNAEWITFIRDKTYQDLTPNDRSIILDVLNSYKNVDAIQNTAKIVCECKKITKIDSGSDCIYDRVSIVKMEDEWFYLSYAFLVKVIGREKGIVHDDFYYKCDQISGVVECIKYLLKDRLEKLKKLDESFIIDFKNYTII